MGVGDDAKRRRVLVPQALGADEFLRVTWHEDRTVMVFSHWQGDRCVAATPVRVSDIAELAELTVSALASTVHPATITGTTDGTAPHTTDESAECATWPPPQAADQVA